MNMILESNEWTVSLKLCMSCAVERKTLKPAQCIVVNLIIRVIVCIIIFSFGIWVWPILSYTRASSHELMNLSEISVTIDGPLILPTGRLIEMYWTESLTVCGRNAHFD